MLLRVLIEDNRCGSDAASGCATSGTERLCLGAAANYWREEGSGL